MTTTRLLYVTIPNREEALSIAEELIERRLIACANLLPQMESIYRWDGKTERAQECVLILKTEATHVAKATKAIEELHSYDVPCILEIPVQSGSQGYLDWIDTETRA